MNRRIFTAHTVRRQHASYKEVMLRNRKVRFFSAIMLVVIVLALVYVWTRIQVVQLGYDVSGLTSEVKELNQQKSILQAEVAKLRSPARLDEIARTKLGMRLPFGDEIIFVEK
ncbi:MAG: cell division protein FtsL [Pseudomonadota bacterium]